MNNYNYLLKFIIVGDICVGKSCLVLQFTDSKFRNEHDATIGVEFGSKYTTINDKRIKLQIWDTSGQEAFKSIVRSYYRGSIGGILVFDVTSRQSFENITKWNKEIQSYACDKIEMTLVGNKIDLNEKRQVSRDEAQAFAKREGFTYFETSAKTGENVNNVFEQMAKIILKRIDCGDIDPSQDVQLQYGIKIGSGNKELQNRQEEQGNKKSINGQTIHQRSQKVQGKDDKGCC